MKKVYTLMLISEMKKTNIQKDKRCIDQGEPFCQTPNGSLSVVEWKQSLPSLCL